MPPALKNMRALLTLALITTAMCPLAWAEIQVPTSTVGTLDGLVVGTTDEAVNSNLTLLTAKVAELNSQIAADRRELSGMANTNTNYAALQARISLYEATVNALQRIMAQLNAGYGIASYEVVTDAATLVTTVNITMTNDTGGEVVITEPIPSSGEETTGSGNDGADMLTQILQQLAQQFSMGGAGGNPLAKVQQTLNNLVQGAGPVEGIQCTNSDAKAGNGVAVYDIAAGKVYMPDGSVMDATSGIGAMRDNPAFVNQRMRGPTPPNTYNLSLRQGLFHGVQAIRMTPTDPGAMYGRDGILAHSPLLRAGGSHGCVAFANYDAFLAAFQRGQVKQLVVVANSDEAKKAACHAPQVDTPSPQSKAMPSS
ncbi:MAG: DUF2778 domain-containing protein [Alphaproteobacteria bacterium]|nr:MAG: DUF2778 domain-containing protein [Alphaproteobacteria bacterium]